MMGDMFLLDSFNSDIERLKESREAAPTLKFSEIKKVGSALNYIRNSGRLGSYVAVNFAYMTRNAFIEKYNPVSADELTKGALYLLEADEKLCSSKELPYLNIAPPKDCELTYESRECFNNREFGGWIECGKRVKSVADVVERAILLDEMRYSGRQNLSSCIKGKKEKLLDFTLQFADISLLSETMKRIANQELTTSSSIIRRKYEDDREIGGNDWEVENTREIISKRISLRRRGLGDVADEVGVKIVRGENLIMPEPIQA